MYNMMIGNYFMGLVVQNSRQAFVIIHMKKPPAKLIDWNFRAFRTTLLALIFNERKSSEKRPWLR